MFCGNSGIFDGILTCALSIMKRSKLDEGVGFYILTMDATQLDEKYTPINEKQIKMLSRAVRSYRADCNVTLIDVSDIYREELAGCPNEDAYCSPYTMIRLFADRIECIPDKILYLDADVMFNRDIALLYNMDVEKVQYAAARDHYGKYLVYPNYINAGVLLLNMKRIREDGVFADARELLRKKKLRFADQSALIRSTAKKKLLAQKFNDQKFLHRHTVVRHFSKRLFWFPYPHTENLKQWYIDRVHKVFGYRVFDDICGEYVALKECFRRENAREQ
jgi:lipopolysaccharide biosynthesis glycosyltransferase